MKEDPALRRFRLPGFRRNMLPSGMLLPIGRRDDSSTLHEGNCENPTMSSKWLCARVRHAEPHATYPRLLKRRASCEQGCQGNATQILSCVLNCDVSKYKARPELADSRPLLYPSMDEAIKSSCSVHIPHSSKQLESSPPICYFKNRLLKPD